MTDGAFLAADWGTTNRRVYRIASDDVVEATECGHRGVVSLAREDYPAEAPTIRGRLGDLPVLCAWSGRGRAKPPYASAPARIEQLRICSHWVAASPDFIRSHRGAAARGSAGQGNIDQCKRQQVS